MKTTKRQQFITVIRRSCLTGKAVWIYRGPSRGAAKKAYFRACKKEVERMKTIGKVVEQRIANVIHFLKECNGGGELTPSQAQVVRQMQAAGKKEAEEPSEFYRHIMEMRRRRSERKKTNNSDYDK
jgi:hypothetical protein